MADLSQEEQEKKDEAILNDHLLNALYVIANEIKAIREMLFYVCFEESETKENQVVKQ